MGELLVDYGDFSVGTTPYDETPQQVGMPDYDHRLAKIEAQAFIKQLERQYASQLEELGPDVQFKVTENSHDFGPYWDVEIKYNSDSEEALDLAIEIDDHILAYWDVEALSYLIEHNVPVDREKERNNG